MAAFKVTGFIEFGRARGEHAKSSDQASSARRSVWRSASGRWWAAVRRLITCGWPDREQPGEDPLSLGRGLPVVLRAPVGGGTAQGRFTHRIEAWFTHVAGLKVIAPATPADARLLLAAFEDGNPVLFLEHKFLRSAKGRVRRLLHSPGGGQNRQDRQRRLIVTWGVGVVSGWRQPAHSSRRARRSSDRPARCCRRIATSCWRPCASAARPHVHRKRGDWQIQRRDRGSHCRGLRHSTRR